MRIGVLSDTHGRQLSLKRALKSMGDIDLLFHLGDYTRDAMYIQNTKKIPVIYVRGNCDYSCNSPYYEVYNIGSKKIFVTHGHLYNVKYGYEGIIMKGRDMKVNVVLFGHTHVPTIFEKYGILFINPGSAGLLENGNRSTYAILQVTDNSIVPSIKTSKRTKHK